MPGKLSQKTLKRIFWLDLVRAFAIITVVLNHIVKVFYSFSDTNAQAMLSLSPQSRIFATICFLLSRLGVPLFLFLTGYFMLDKTYSEKDIRKFWRTKCLGLLIAAVFWNIAYYLFSVFYFNYQFDLWKFIQSILFFRGADSHFGHMWYVNMILGIYLTLPFFANVINKTKDKTIFRLPFVVFFTLLFGIPLINAIITPLGVPAITSLINYGFTAGIYGLYLLGGYLVKKGTLKNLSTKKLIFISSSSFLLMLALQLFSFHARHSYNPWYDYAPLYLCAISLFELCSRIKEPRHKKLVTSLSYYSFAIFLTHQFFKILLEPTVSELNLDRPP